LAVLDRAGAGGLPVRADHGCLGQSGDHPGRAGLGRIAKHAALAFVPAADSAYAAREGESKDLENFKGGEPVVIVTSTAVLIVAIILLIVLI
jgi:hypothetical protein